MFPTFAALSPDRKSRIVTVHLWLFDPGAQVAGRRAIARKTLVALLARRLGLSQRAGESAIFRARAGAFLVDNAKRKKITVTIGAQRFEIGPTRSNGHVRTELVLPIDEIDPHLVEGVLQDTREIPIAIDLPGRRGEVLHHTVPCLESGGISVISDLDDTIKVSLVADKKALLRNTFCREFEAVSGMAELYRELANSGVAFHYVSASPWQLHASIEAFLTAHDFPRGSLSLKSFRWKDSSFFDLFAKSDEIKRPLIEDLFRAFPSRSFILVGDSGEQDPELYASIARDFPRQVKAIMIRNSSGEPHTVSRWSRVFGALPRDLWTVFSTPEEIDRSKLLDLVR